MRAPLFLGLAALTLGGCAKFPADGAASQYTRLTFRITMNGTVDPNCIYAVAIRTFTTDLPTDDTFGPVPVVQVNDTSSGSRNGYVEGRPNRLILYRPGESVEGYLVYKFLPTGNASDPISLIPVLTGEVYPNSGVNPNSPPAGVDPNTLGFTIDTRDLVDDSSTAQTIRSIQFNIIATNKPLIVSGDASGRAIDAIGNQRNLAEGTLNAYFPATLVTSDTYPKGGSPVIETTEDMFGVNPLPTVDIKSWSLTVRTP